MIDYLLPFRYLFKRRITYLAVVSVALCCFVIFVVMTVMSGLVGGHKQRIHDHEGDCVVGTSSLVGFPYYESFLETLDQADFVAAASPVVHNYGYATRGRRQLGFAVEILGIDPNRHSRATAFGDSLHWHQANPDLAFVALADPNQPGCVVGIDIVLQRNDRSEYNHSFSPLDEVFELTCFPLNARGAPARGGAGDFNTKTYVFSDTSHTAMAKADQRRIAIALAEAQWLCGMSGVLPRISAIHLSFLPEVPVTEGVQRVRALWQDFLCHHREQPYADLLEGVRVQDWRHYRYQIISPMEREQGAMAALFLLVALTTVFIIFVVFYMIISHKIKDIGILRSIGLSQIRLIGLFLRFAALVGLLGGGLGIALAMLFLRHAHTIEDWLYETYQIQIMDRTIFTFGDLPTQVEVSTVVVLLLAAVLVCLLGAVLPVIKAARLRPVEILQVNPL